MENGRLRRRLTKGRCYMQNGDEEPFKLTADCDYCPDYLNRKKGDKQNGLLTEWIKTIPKI